MINLDKKEVKSLVEQILNRQCKHIEAVNINATLDTFADSIFSRFVYIGVFNMCSEFTLRGQFATMEFYLTGNGTNRLTLSSTVENIGFIESKNTTNLFVMFNSCEAVINDSEQSYCNFVGWKCQLE